jgi:hypothetical protein
MFPTPYRHARSVNLRAALRWLGFAVGVGMMASCGTAAPHASSPPPAVHAAVPTGPVLSLQAFTMATPSDGAAVTVTTLYQTVDGGRRWVPVRRVSPHTVLFSGPGGRLLLVSLSQLRPSGVAILTGLWQPGTPWMFHAATVPLSFQTDGGYPTVACSLRAPAAAWCLFSDGGGMGLDATQLWQTVNGGVTWTAQSGGNTPAGTEEAGLKGVPVWTTAADGWLPASVLVTTSGVVEAPVLYETADGGRNWRPVPVPVPTFSGTPGLLTMAAPAPVPGRSAWVSLLSASNASGTASRLQLVMAPDPDGAWTLAGRSVTVEGPTGTAEVFLTSPATWWVWTGQALYRTNDEGRAWQPVVLPTPVRTALARGAATALVSVVGPRAGWLWLQDANGTATLWQMTGAGWHAVGVRVLGS